MTNKIPNLVIAGVNKSGTTSLFTYLSYHPDICVSNIKETCFFLPYRYGEEKLPIEQYSKFFTHYRDEKVILESTPGYFYGGKKVAEAIKKECPNVRIYALLREPVSRIVSFYNYKKSRMDLPKNMTLDKYVEQCLAMDKGSLNLRKNNLFYGVEGGFYSPYIEDWFDVFGDDFKVIFLDDLIKKPKQLLKDIANDLEIDASFFDAINLDIENKSIDYKLGALHKVAISVNHYFEKIWRLNPNVKKFLRNIYFSLNSQQLKKEYSTEVIKKLNSIYAPFNKELKFKLLKRGYKNLPNWLIK